LVSIDPRLRPGRGAPPKQYRVPGFRLYSHVVAHLYRRKLEEWGHDWVARQRELGQTPRDVPAPDRRTLSSLWEGAKREARRQIAQEYRDAIPADMRVRVEREAPWCKALAQDSAF